MDINTKKIQIEQTLNSAGWKHIEEIISDNIKLLSDPTNVSGNLRNDIYAREVRSRVMAAKTLRNILKQIKIMGRINMGASDKDYE